MKFSTKLFFPMMAAALLSAGAVEAQVYATSSSNYNPGPLADGVSPIGSVRPARTNPNNVVGFVDPATNDSNIGEGSGTVQFVSLGYGGSIELQFATPICNIAGPDFKVWETSYGNSSNCVAWPERAAIYARQDACQPWILLTPETGQCLDFEVDLGFLSWASEIRIEDRTDETTPVFQSSNQDAFDVDGIEGYVGCAMPMVNAADKYSPNAVTAISQGLRNNGTGVLASRSIQSKMLFAPQMSDVATSAANNNFYAMGYAGSTTLAFPYTIINGAGADLQVFETTFGDNAARTCASYPEKARFEGSIDGVTFFDLEAEVTADDAGAVLCRDGKLNIPAAYGGINYIKVTDVTVLGTVPGLSDGYDIDGIVGLNQCAVSTNSGRNAESYTEVIGEGEYGVSVYPNPADKLVSIEINATNSTDNYTVIVTDVMGRVVANEVILNNASSSMIQNMDITALPAGLYVVSVKNNDNIEVSRFVKK
jgi:Secretion system C-terminal sorting domain